MSQEIAYRLQATLSNGNVQDELDSLDLTADQTTASLVKNTQTFPAAAAGTAVELGGVVTPGFAYFANLENPTLSAVEVEIGRTDGGVFRAFAKLKPGERCFFRLGTTAPMARASTGTVRVLYTIFAA